MARPSMMLEQTLLEFEFHVEAFRMHRTIDDERTNIIGFENQLFTNEDRIRIDRESQRCPCTTNAQRTEKILTIPMHRTIVQDSKCKYNILERRNVLFRRCESQRCPIKSRKSENDRRRNHAIEHNSRSDISNDKKIRNSSRRNQNDSNKIKVNMAREGAERTGPRVLHNVINEMQTSKGGHERPRVLTSKGAKANSIDLIDSFALSLVSISRRARRYVGCLDT